MVSDDDGDQDALAEEYDDRAALLVKKLALTRGFSDDGKRVEPVEFRVLGDRSACMDAFQTHSSRQSFWRRTGSPYSLSNRTNFPDPIAIPIISACFVLQPLPHFSNEDR